MATWRFVNFPHPEAQVLADLTGIESDLEAVEDYCQSFLSVGADFDFDRLKIQQALCIAAIVTYGRTFGSGVRKGVTALQLDRLEPDLRQFHDYVKDLRDKWVAHSVNAFEENIPVAYLVPPERGERSISSISVQHRRVAALSGSEVERLSALARALRDIVNADLSVENARVLRFARSLDVNAFYDGDDSSPHWKTGPEVARKARARLGKG